MGADQQKLIREVIENGLTLVEEIRHQLMSLNREQTEIREQQDRQNHQLISVWKRIIKIEERV